MPSPSLIPPLNVIAGLVDNASRAAHMTVHKAPAM